MVWKVMITTRSGEKIHVSNLQNINVMSLTTGGIEKFTDFKNFFMPVGNLVFVGEKNSVTLYSDDVANIQFSED